MEVEVRGFRPLSQGVLCFISLSTAWSWEITANAGFLSDKTAGLSNKKKGHPLAPKNWAEESERNFRCYYSRYMSRDLNRPRPDKEVRHTITNQGDRPNNDTFYLNTLTRD